MQFSTVSTIKDLKSFCSKNLKDEPPFINFDFFYYLEITNCTGKHAGWVPEHIIIKENNSIIGVIPNFRKFNSYGEYVFDQIFENAHHQLGFEYYPKYLSAIPFTPVTRKRFFYIMFINIYSLCSNIKSINDFKSKIYFFHNPNISWFFPCIHG